MTHDVEFKSAFFASYPLFEGLSQDELRRVEQMAEFKVKSKFSAIYLPGDPSDSVYFLVKGAVKVATHSDDGKEVIKSLLHPVAMFGELGLIGEKTRSDFAYALKEEAHVYCIRVEDFRKLMRANPLLSERVMMLFGNRLLRAESKLESLLFKDARTRIIDFIKESINNRGRKIGFEMLLKHSLTHQDIANITFTSRQTVTLVLNELKKSDLIYFNRGKILVRDLARLA
jgi:CRP-like cAMP-binding protein